MTLDDAEEIQKTVDVPFWGLALGAFAFVVGIGLLGHKTIQTVANGITKFTPTKSFATQISAGIAVLLSSFAELPVSTSHCLVGAVVGVAIGEKLVSKEKVPLTLSTLKKIVLSWITTIPLAMLAAIFFYYALNGAIDEDNL